MHVWKKRRVFSSLSCQGRQARVAGCLFLIGAGHASRKCARANTLIRTSEHRNLDFPARYETVLVCFPKNQKWYGKATTFNTSLYPGRGLYLSRRILSCHVSIQP